MAKKEMLKDLVKKGIPGQGRTTPEDGGIYYKLKEETDKYLLNKLGNKQGSVENLFLENILEG